jgi:hypothetical protein
MKQTGVMIESSRIPLLPYRDVKTLSAERSEQPRVWNKLVGSRHFVKYRTVQEQYRKCNRTQ